MNAVWTTVPAAVTAAGFFEAATENVFLRHALWAGLLASLACGVVGGYVTARRLTYVAGGVAHCVLGGVGAVLYGRAVFGWEFSPLYGAVVVALFAAFLIGRAGLRGREREDTVVAAVWAVGMAAGLLFISQTPGYAQDLAGWLFGTPLTVSDSDLFLLAVLDIPVLAAGLLFYNRFQAVCFDSEFARLRGLKVEFWYSALLVLTALTVVLLLSVVGVVLTVALLALPAAAAGRFTHTLGGMMFWAVGFCLLFTLGGTAVSYELDWPSGAVIALLAGATYLVVVGLQGLHHRFSSRKKGREKR